MDAEVDGGARELETRILGQLVDPMVLRLLAATAGRPRTVRDLCEELRLPLASVYRKVNDLHAAGALRASEVRDAATGKPARVYVSAVTSLQVVFSSPGPRVVLTLAPAGTGPPG